MEQNVIPCRNSNENEWWSGADDSEWR